MNRIHDRRKALVMGGRFCLSVTLLFSLAALPRQVRADETDDIAEAMQLRPGHDVADVGAGGGEWTENLSRGVGKTGRVFSTEVDSALVERLRQRFDRPETDNVTVVLGTQEATGLPTACCDAILLRLVYHHLTHPARMAADLRRALRPRGRAVIIDMLPQPHMPAPAGVPDRGGHGISPDDLIEEMKAAGFQFVYLHDDWAGRSERFCAVFVRD